MDLKTKKKLDTVTTIIIDKHFKAIWGRIKYYENRTFFLYKKHSHFQRLSLI